MNTKENHKKTKEMVKNISGFFIKSIGLLAGIGVLGILLLALAYTIPVKQELKESTFAYSSHMGWAPLVNNRYSDYDSFFKSYEPGVLDDATDLIILNNAFDEGEENVFERAADMNNYGRYWHGYVSVLRPIFYFIDYWDYLLLNSYLQLFLMGCAAYGVYKVTKKRRYLLAFGSSCIFLTPAATALSLQYSPVFYISMLGSLFCMLKTEWILQKQRRYYTFLVLGILTCYFDLLTYPLLSFAFPFCWLLVAAGDKIKPKEQFQLLIGGGMSFILGYGGFFVTKWLIQAVICGKEILADGVSNMLVRLGSAGEDYMLMHQNYCRIDTLYNNFRHYLFPAFVFVLAAWMAVLIYNYLRGSLVLRAEQIIFAAVTLTSPAWYLILNNHTTIHHLFTHRIYGASILGFMLFVCGSVSESVCGRLSIGIYIKKMTVLIICFGVGVCASRLAKEDWSTIHGGENTELLLVEGDVLEFEFSPSIETIKGFTFCISPNTSTDGYIYIDICDGDEVCANQSIPIEQYKESVFVFQLTDWNLQAGKTYMMKTYIKDNPAGIRILVTPEGDKPQTEYGRAYLNQEQLGDIAPLSGIVYRGHLQTIPIKLFLAGCVGVFLLVWILAISTGWKIHRDGTLMEFLL